MLRRIGVIVAALIATLAFAASAQAAPSTPNLNPLPYWVCGSSVGASWTPSTPEPGGVIWGYRVDVGDLSTGTSSYKYVTGLSTTIGGLVANHHYVVRVRAIQYRYGVVSYSASSGDTFVRKCPFLPADVIKRYVEYNPWPECPQCGRRFFEEIDDPVIQRQLATAVLPGPERIQGVELDERGGIIIIGG